MKNIIIDCHNHTLGSKFDKDIKGSDGFDYVEYFAQVAKEKELTMCAISEHDTVNRKLKELLQDTEILVPEAVEISAKNYDRDKSLHILYYAQTVSKEVDELLLGVLDKKKQMLILQVLKLKEFGFQINFDEVDNFILNEGYGKDGVNKWNITKCIFLGVNSDFNLKYFYEIFGKQFLEEQDKKDEVKEKATEEYRWFYFNCMKSGGDFYNQFKVETENYEPDINIIGELAKKDNAILSIAHPNFTFKKGVDEFKNELPYYLDAGVNAIEFNAKVDYKWGNFIMEMKEKYDLILTFGSDCHMIGGDDEKHATFGTVSPFINQEIIEEHFNKFREKTGV